MIYAGAVIVNKEDLMDSAAKTRVKVAIHKINSAAPIYFTRYCDVDIGRLTAHLKPAEALGKDTTNSPGRNRPQTYVLKLLPLAHTGGRWRISLTL